MTAQQRELLRTALLSSLEASGAYAPTIPVLLVTLRTSGYPRATEDEIRAELTYLQDKGMAAPVAKALSIENAKWRITADGRDHLAMEGLA